MFKVGHYHNSTRATLWDHLPWACLIAPGVVLNKDGSFMRTIRFRGPDLDSSTTEELVSFRARVNNALKRLGSNWCVHIEASRRESRRYPESRFASGIAGLIDAERRRSFTADCAQFESYCFITFQYLPPPETKARLADLFIERVDENKRGARWQSRTPAVNYRAHLDYFQANVEQVGNILSAFLPEAVALDDSEMLSYLHDCISERSFQVAVPEVPQFLDVALADTPLIGGLSPQLGNHYLKTVSIRAFAPRTVVCMLDALNDLALWYRWVVRWLPMDKQEATSLLNKLRRQWFAKRKGIWALLKEVITKEPSQLEDTDALAKAAETDTALQSLGADHASYGYLTLTITTRGASESEAIENARLIQQVVDSTGMISQIEDFNAVQAWLGTLPGHAYADVRRPLVSSLNLCDLIPLSSVWSGPALNAHLDGPVLMHTKARGGSAFRFDLHQGDVGHTLVAGPTGSGKSTLLNLIMAQWQRYPGAQVFIFDKGRSARVMTEAMQGAWYEPGGDDGSDGHQPQVCFQPLADVDDEAEATWAMQWVGELLRLENVELDPHMKGELWDALQNFRQMPRPQRTISTLYNLVQNEHVRLALRNYTIDGAHGHLLDAEHDTLSERDGEESLPWIAIEMQHLMQRKAVLVPVLTYLFHRLEKRFDGRPTLLVLDEAWLYLSNTHFAEKVHEWLKTLRKSNVAVIFATQSLSDVAQSEIAPAIVENCLTRVFLPNAAALEPATRQIYESFGLNLRQIQILASATPKQDYYYCSRQGNRLFQLDLGPVQRALCGSSRPEDLKRLQQLRHSHGKDWIDQWLSPGADRLLNAIPDDMEVDHALPRAV
jgi:type IV secretion system protein VirB4